MNTAKDHDHQGPLCEDENVDKMLTNVVLNCDEGPSSAKKYVGTLPSDESQVTCSKSVLDSLGNKYCLSK